MFSIEINMSKNIWYITSSLIIKLGRREPSSGGTSDPRLPNDPFLSRTTSILGGSSTGALISGTFGFCS